MSKLKLGSLFSGCGGFDLGFKKAGFELAWANDLNPDACETYRQNIAEIYENSIYDLDAQNFEEVDVLTAGFPCQPFSNAGSRKGRDDERGTLVDETFRFIRATNPKVIIYENVRGILSFEEDGVKMIDVLKNRLSSELGYNMTYRLLNFSHFGVPQNRLRVIMIAVKEDSDLSPESLYPEISFSMDLSIEQTLKSIPKDASGVNEIMKLNPQAIRLGKLVPEGGSWKSIAYDELPERWKKIRNDMKRYHYPNFFKRYHRQDVMGTITAAFKPENAAVWHPYEDRIYSLREIARFQTFPDDFNFYGKNTKVKYAQIGNAVPPKFSERLANRIQTVLDRQEHSNISKETFFDYSEINVNRPLHKQTNANLSLRF